jgi:hypothetical protein
MNIGPGITIGGGITLSESLVLPAGDTNLAFNSVDFFNQFTFVTNTLSLTFNTDGTITASGSNSGPTRWYTTTPVASAYEIAVKATLLNITGIGTGVFSIAGVPQSISVKSSYYPLTSGVTINTTFTGYTPSSDEILIIYDVFIRRTDLTKEIIRVDNQMNIFPDT